MFFEPDALYHIYNRSNETVFRNRENYLFFLKKIKSYVFPVCKILAWILMPNHFHFLVMATLESCRNVNEVHRPNLQVLSKNIGWVLSSYTQAINKQVTRRGKLFAHNTKAKLMWEDSYPLSASIALSGYGSYNHDYVTTCFLYIHQNPVLAGLAEKPEDWEFSSFRDYAGLRKGKLVDKNLAFEFINLDKDNYYKQSEFLLDESLLKKIF